LFTLCSVLRTSNRTGESTTMNYTGIDYLQRASSLSTLFQAEPLAAREICQIVSLKLFPDEPAHGIGIFALGSDGEYNLKATFGVSAQTQAVWTSGSVSVNSPVVEAMRTSEVVCIGSPEDLSARYPEHFAIHNADAESAIIAVPIRKFGSSLGVLAIFGRRFSIDEDCRVFLELVAGLMALKLNWNFAAQPDEAAGKSLPLRDEALTNRERLVQGLMRLGKTNAEIADELGYSESTIRQDAVSMFSKLGVKNRKEAGDLLEEN
jgi:DNA-binding CsgD family transcriptional regulator